MAILCVDRGDTGSQKQVSGEMCAVLHGYQLEITQQLLNLPQNKRYQDFPSGILLCLPQTHTTTHHGLGTLCISFLRKGLEYRRHLLFFRVQYNQPQDGVCIFETNKGAKPTVGPRQSFLPSFGLEIGATQLLLQPNGQHFFTPGHVSSVTHLLKQDCFRTTLGHSPFLPVAKRETATKKRDNGAQ